MQSVNNGVDRRQCYGLWDGQSVLTHFDTINCIHRYSVLLLAHGETYRNMPFKAVINLLSVS